MLSVRRVVTEGIRRAAVEVRHFLDKEKRERDEKAAELAHLRHGELSYELRRLADVALHLEGALKALAETQREEGRRVEREVATGIDALVEHTALLGRTVAGVEAALARQQESSDDPDAVFVPFVVERLKGKKALSVFELSPREGVLSKTLAALGHDVKVRGSKAIAVKGKAKVRFDAVLAGFESSREELSSARALLQKNGLLVTAGAGAKAPSLEGFSTVETRSATLAGQPVWLLCAKAV